MHNESRENIRVLGRKIGFGRVFVGMRGHRSTVRERTAGYASFALSVACVFFTSCGGGGASGGATIQPVPHVSLRSTSIFVGPAAGTTGAALVTSENGASVSWTASTSTAWIHLTDTSGGTASLGSVARFTYDANTGATRQGSITYQSSDYSGTLTVTQAGVGYAATLPAPTTLLTLPNISAFAVDLSGNLYYFVNGGATTPGTLQEWMASTGTSKTLNFPSPTQCSVIVDAAQALYVNEAATLIADLPQEVKCAGLIGDQPIDLTLQWLLAAPNSTLIEYQTPQMSYWAGFTPDFKGNNFAAVSTQGNAGPTTSSTSIYGEGANGLSSQAIATLPYFASGFTGDTSGNFFMIGASASSPYDYTIVSVNPQSSSSSVLADLPPNTVPMGLALDGSGNLYSLLLDPTAPTYPTYYLTQWSQSNNQLTRMSPTQQFDGIYGDGVGNIYAETPSGDIQEFTPVFVNTTAVAESMAAGSDQLPPVLPGATTFTAISDSSWLTITGQSDGVVSFSFAATSVPRTGHIAILGESIPVSQESQASPAVKRLKER